MSEDWRNQVWDLFDRAVELDDEKRLELLDRECLDPLLRKEVESLLRHATQEKVEFEQDSFLQSPLIRFRLQSGDVRQRLPERIGRYKVLSLLGIGAMGRVYEAEQDQPRRLVAVKVLRSVHVSKDLQRRFFNESQILGTLQHRGIAQIYDAGIDDEGQPFFAMELIHGLPIDEFTNSRNLSIADRLRLMASVCDAVQHAHDKGVIHRDLKPSNILVNEEGQCKILDFGIARSSNSEINSATSNTETGQLLGTLAYMSPEQVSAKSSEVDSTADVYALGMVLYDLLLGKLPYELKHLPLPEAARVIRDFEPPKIGTIDRRFHGDIETIVAKSLEKERSRRYPSPGALRDDIYRHLAHEPVLARPASTVYRLQKFSRRNRTALAIIGALSIGMLGTTWFAVQAWRMSAIAMKEQSAALSEAYVARITAAGNAIENFNVAQAQTQLDAAPKSLRGWEWRHLAGRLDTSLRKQEFSPSHRSHASSSSDGLYVQHSDARSTVVQDINERIVIRIDYPWPVQFVYPARILGDEARISVFAESRLKVVTQAGQVLLDLEPPKPYLGRVDRFSGDLKLFAMAWRDHRDIVELYDLETGNRLRSFKGHTGRIYGLCFSADGQQIASSGEDGTVRLWETESGKELQVCLGHQGNVWSVAFRPDGKRIVSASADGTVRQWSTESGKEVTAPFERHQGDVVCACYHPNGLQIASSSHDRTIRIWDSETAKQRLALYGPTHASTTLSFDASGQVMASGGDSSTVRFWNAKEDEANPFVLRGHDKYVYPAIVSPDGLWIASGGWDSKVNVWNVRTGQLTATRFYNDHPMKSLAFTPDSSSIITIAGTTPYFRRWNFRTGEIAMERVTESLPEVPATLSVSTDGLHLASAGLSGSQVWDRATGSLIKNLCQIDCYHHKLAYSLDGKWLIGPGPGGGATSIWSTQSYSLHAELQGDQYLTFAAAFSPDSRLAATGGPDRQLRLWDVAGGKLLKVLSGHTDEIFAIAFHPTEPRLASGGRDRLVRIWDLESGKEVASLSGHSNYIWSLAFTPDGETLVSGSGDTTVRLWSTRSASEFYREREK